MDDENLNGKLTRPDEAGGLANIRRALAQSQGVIEWTPEPGGTLVGIITGAVPEVGPFGPGHKLLICDENGQTWGLWLTDYLRKVLGGYGVTTGSPVGITFQGMQEGRSGRRFRAYRVVAERGQGVPLLEKIYVTD